MKWIKRGAIALLVLALIGGVVFWGKIQDIRALQNYAAVFEPENLDENFRTLHQIYPSISIPQSEPVAEFVSNPDPDVIPETYSFNGSDEPVGQLFERFHWTGLIVLKDGELIHEAYARGNTDKTHHIEFSVTSH
ncbi:hypothetical protein [Ruegeria hyattellae]|uniref:hypothetical protein n=1 Tax=Ruegeria hyattellae TaxID=3233337 RepID=UPI00355C62E7